jgi:uncharacterized membrane protein
MKEQMHSYIHENFPKKRYKYTIRPRKPGEIFIGEILIALFIALMLIMIYLNYEANLKYQQEKKQEKEIDIDVEINKESNMKTDLTKFFIRNNNIFLMF